MTTSADPFTLIEQALWACLESSPAIHRLVGLNNRVRMSDDEPNVKPESVLAADVPELVVVPAGGTFNAPNTGVSSHSCTVTQTFLISVLSDTLSTSQLERSVNPIKWAIFCAMERNFLSREGLPGLDFVRMARAIDFQDTNTPQPSPIPGREIRSWRTVMNVTVTAIFNRTVVQGLN